MASVDGPSCFLPTHNFKILFIIGHIGALRLIL